MASNLAPWLKVVVCGLVSTMLSFFRYLNVLVKGFHKDIFLYIAALQNENDRQISRYNDWLQGHNPTPNHTQKDAERQRIILDTGFY